ncbi:FAD-dependent oxidoreductase [Alicyclobacillus tolerans]|uniref:oxidoreductase n=1 Tax=Alicyclobacillus tolerans TaxID=90970 RepID=UPI003B80263D
MSYSAEQINEFSNLKNPGKIGTLHLPHRVLMGSMHLGLEAEPEVFQRLVAFYEERAKGGAALMITGGVAVLPEGGGDHMFCLTDSEHDFFLAELVQRIHQVGGKVAMQLFHSGRYAFSKETGMPSYAPSAIASNWTRETPVEMSIDDIQRTIQAFASGALKAKKWGYDAIEVMGSEGYLLNEFLSPLTNHRKDEYGGSLAGRMRISLEVVRAIREQVGENFPLIFRMSGLDCMPGSTNPDETLEFAKCLEMAGVDALNIGIGWHESQVPTVAAVVPRAAFSTVAASIKEVVNIPILVANRVNTPEVAEHILSQGWADFIAPARPWLADAEFANKALSQQRQFLNVCVACNQACLDHTMAQPPQPVSCMVNPRTGAESLYPIIFAQKKKKIAVIGGGPAGLEAARAAASRGHQVVLFERQAQLGGQFRLAARVPGKEEFYETLRYFEHVLQQLHVEVRLSHNVHASELTSFDAVIVATGVHPRIPSIPGVELPHVVTYPEVLTGQVILGKRLLVLGTGGIGCDVTKYLLETAAPPAEVSRFAKQYDVTEVSVPVQRTITLVSRSDKWATGIGKTTRWIVRRELNRPEVKLVKQFQPLEIRETGLWGQTPEGEKLLEADQIILCTGQETSSFDVEVLAKRIPIFRVGGAKDASQLNAVRAMREAFEAAYAL